ncbi:MAG: hypothetical protein M3077_14130 [Candidatus Dormibacteraeota bacterium]|nr:hypothetical protein [Candidatus Dormibacteraeota bacterium]
MIKNHSVGLTAAGAVGGGLINGGVLGTIVALMDPAMPNAIVLVGTAIYGGAVWGGLLGALVAIVRSELGLDGTPVVQTVPARRAA